MYQIYVWSFGSKVLVSLPSCIYTPLITSLPILSSDFCLYVCTTTCMFNTTFIYQWNQKSRLFLKKMLCTFGNIYIYGLEYIVLESYFNLKYTMANSHPGLQRTERTKATWKFHINIFVKNENKNLTKVRTRSQTLQI